MFAHPKETSNIPIQRIYGKHDFKIFNQTHLRWNNLLRESVKWNTPGFPIFCFEGPFIVGGGCPGCIYPQGQRLRHLGTQRLRPLGAARPHALRLRERAPRREPCCTGPGDPQNGTKRGQRTRKRRCFFEKKTGVGVCGSVFAKKQFLFIL